MPGGRRRALSLTAGAVLLCSCFFARVRCGGEREQEEIQRLRSKVASLEDEVGWGKDETSQLESVVRERTAQIAALVSGLEALQVRNVADDETVVKASTNTAMIEKQIERLGSDLEDQVKKGELLEARASEAEKSLLQLGQKLDRVEKINAEQSRKIEELEHDVQHSEDKLSELQQQAELKAEELAIVRGMWLPYWFASRSVHCQVAETLAHAQGLVEPHLQATQNKKLAPVSEGHFSSLKKGARPYVAWIAAASEPYISRASAALEPYTRPAASAWRRLASSSTSMYHGQASAVFALAVFSIYKIFSATVRKKIQVRIDRGGGGPSDKHTRRVNE